MVVAGVRVPDATRTTEQEKELGEAICALMGGNDTERKTKVDIDALLSPNGGILIPNVGFIPTRAQTIDPDGGKEDKNAADAKLSAEEWERYWFQDYSTTRVDSPSKVETPAAGASTPLAEAAESAVEVSDARKQKEPLMWQAEAAACASDANLDEGATQSQMMASLTVEQEEQDHSARWADGEAVESPYGKAKTGPAGGDGFFKLYKVSSFSSDLDNEYDHITEEQMTEWAKDYKLDQGAAEKWSRMDIEDKQRIVAHGSI
eukprot:g17677.t1